MLVKAKSSKYESTCARDGCSIKIEIGKPYVFDRDGKEGKKAYCSVECAEMQTGKKVVENNGFKKKTRTSEEKFADAEIMIRTLWPMAEKKAQEFLKADAKSQNILAQVLFKKACDNWISG